MNYLILILTLNFFSIAPPTKRIINLIDSDKLDFSYEINDLSEIILNEMEAISDYKIEIANPDENFNKSDAIENNTWPRKRLVFLATLENKKEWLMYYEIGGKAHNTRLIYCRLAKNGKVRKLYCIGPNFNSGFNKSKNTLIKMLKSGEFEMLYNNGKPMKRNWIPF